MRIGELLLGAGTLDAEELARGLKLQKATRGRLGSTLVEMGAVSADEVARGLARQHGVPAALERHLAGRDPALTQRLPAAVARAHWALPVALSRGGDGLNLVVCLRDPLPGTIAEIRAAAGMPVIPSVASEHALRRELDLAYPLPAAKPERAPAAGAVAAAGAAAAADDDDGSFDIDFYEPSQTFANLGEDSLVDLDHGRVSKDPDQLKFSTTGSSSILPKTGSTGSMPAVGGAATKTTGSMPALGATPAPAAPAPAPAAPAPAAPIAPAPPPAPVVAPAAPTLRLDEAIAAIDDAPTADRVAELATDYLRGAWKGGLVMAVKEKMALGQRGFGGALTMASVESIVVPLDQPSVLRTAHDDRRPFLGEAPIGSLAQDRFMRLFAELKTRTIAVSPVIVRGRPASLLFAIGPRGALPAAGAGIAALAHAMGEAYLRIILAAKQKP